jgi:hypothetical protein
VKDLSIALFIVFPSLFGIVVACLSQVAFSRLGVQRALGVILALMTASLSVFVLYFLPLVLLIEPLELGRYFPTDNENVGAGVWVTVLLWVPLASLIPTIAISFRRSGA